MASADYFAGLSVCKRIDRFSNQKRSPEFSRIFGWIKIFVLIYSWQTKRERERERERESESVTFAPTKCVDCLPGVVHVGPALPLDQILCLRLLNDQNIIRAC